LKKTLKIDPDLGTAYRLLSRLLKTGSKTAAAGSKKKLPVHKGD
jgi:hypothetical protein